MVSNREVVEALERIVVSYDPGAGIGVHLSAELTRSPAFDSVEYARVKQPSASTLQMAEAAAREISDRWMAGRATPIAFESIAAIIAHALDTRERETVERCANEAASHREWKFKRGGDDPHYTSCEGCGEFIASKIRATVRDENQKQNSVK